MRHAVLCRRIIEFFDGHGVEVRQLWGMTELSPAGTIGAVKASMGRLEGEALVQLKLKQGRPHALLDMRIVGEGGQELPRDGKAFGNLQASVNENEG